jgi:hypothetical protein
MRGIEPESILEENDYRCNPGILLDAHSKLLELGSAPRVST